MIAILDTPITFGHLLAGVGIGIVLAILFVIFVIIGVNTGWLR